MTPSAVHVGNIVQGARMAWAQGRELTSSDEETDNAKKVFYQSSCVSPLQKYFIYRNN